MINRRDLLKWSAVAPVLLGGSQAAYRSVPEGVDGLVVDQRFMGAGTYNPFGKQVFTFNGDVTDMWYQSLDGIWRKPGFVLGGVTGRDALFVLENLAWDRGRRVVQRKALTAPYGAGEAPVSWVIAPVHPSVKV